MKLCIDCKHCREKFQVNYCHSPEHNHTSPVTGQAVGSHGDTQIECLSVRGLNLFFIDQQCGPNAVFFED